MLAASSLPYARTFGYLSAIVSIAIVWTVGSSPNGGGEGWKALFILLTTLSLLFTSSKLFPDENNPSIVALQMLQNPIVAEMDTIYTDGWSDCGYLLDFNSWYLGNGPTVQNIYSDDFNVWLKANSGSYVLSGLKNETKSCEMVVTIENKSVYRCY
jgi:hypothetical protein